MGSILTINILWKNLCQIGIMWSLNISSNHQENSQGLEFTLSEDNKLIASFTLRIIGLFKLSYESVFINYNFQNI